MWCDLWLGYLFCSIWSFIDLRSQFPRIGEDSSLKCLKKPNKGYCVSCFQPTSGAKEFTFYKNLFPRNFKKVQPPKNAPQFFVPSWWRMATPDEFLLLWIAWVWNQRGVKRFPFFNDHHNLFLTKCRNKDDPKKHSQPTRWWMPWWPSNYSISRNQGDPRLTLLRH